ncbi:MAG: holo-ACP synthase [Acidimicrobiales bacterium]
MSAVIGLGLDAVEVERFRRVLARTPRVATRLFTEGEQAYGARFADPAPRLAARFAAKEATMKALGVGLGAFDFRDVEVRTAADGSPSLRLSGRAAALAGERGVTALRVSITHTDHLAEAVVAAL